MGARPFRTFEPSALRMEGVVVLPRRLHRDPRGFLMETLRQDDGSVEGSHFAMSYTSVTVPGQKRDPDRWHVHRLQTDRFVVVMGEMVLALHDARAESPTRGELAAVRMTGAMADALTAPSGSPPTASYLVTIPPGVQHAIANLHPREPFALQNYPTRLYDPADEGRVPFAQAPIPSWEGRTFRWEDVEVVRP